MLNKTQLQALHHASRIFERLGPDGFQQCVNEFGEGVAMACLVTYLRCSFGAINTTPENLRTIPSRVKEILKANHLMDDVDEQQRRHDILEDARRAARHKLDEDRAERRRKRADQIQLLQGEGGRGAAARERRKVQAEVRGEEFVEAAPPVPDAVDEVVAQVQGIQDVRDAREDENRQSEAMAAVKALQARNQPAPAPPADPEDAANAIQQMLGRGVRVEVVDDDGFVVRPVIDEIKSGGTIRDAMAKADEVVDRADEVVEDRAEEVVDDDDDEWIDEYDDSDDYDTPRPK